MLLFGEYSIALKWAYMISQSHRVLRFVSNFQRKERRRFDEDRIRTCTVFQKKWNKGEQWKETVDMTLHGLEDFFGRWSKEETRRMHSAKVLKEQRRQRNAVEELDEVTLRYVSSESSGESRAKALQLGQRHSLAVAASWCS